MRSAALALLLLACGDDNTGVGGIGGIGGVGGAAGVGGSGGSVADVTGTAIIDYVTDSGQMPWAMNLTTIPPPKALVGAQTINGLGDAAGNFIIPQVPDGALVQFGETYVLLGSERRLDFGYEQLGRPDVAYPRMSGTQLNLQMSGMAPWAADDDLEIISSNSGAYGFLVAGAQNPPALTATDLNMTVDWTNLHGI